MVQKKSTKGLTSVRVNKSDVKDFRRMINNLYIETLKDRKITADEKALFNKIEIGYKEFSKTIGDAFDDGVRSSGEEEQIIKLQAKIMQSVIDTAITDNMITSDERIILKKLADHFLHQMSKIDQTSRKDEDP